jgi:hypothetical protein
LPRSCTIPVEGTKTTFGELEARFGAEVAASPPTDWPLQRRREYVLWSEAVVDGCRDVNPKLDQAFDRVIARARAVLDRQE